MVAPLDITGQRYGRLVAISRAPDMGRRTAWLFQCDCGSRHVTRLETVRQGIARSCGCLRIDQTRARSTKHGHKLDRTESRTYKSYSHAKARCENPNNEKFPIYGARGIAMCSEWSADFRAFLRDMGECPPGLTLDRIDVNGGYEPGNCRWANSHQQARTRTDNVMVTHEGRQMILKDFAGIVGVNYKSLHAYVKYRGMTPADAAATLLKR